MAARFVNPFPQFLNSTPTVYSGGTLSFFASGTSTPLAVFSDSTLVTSLGTSITLNSAGRASTDVFLQNVAYKVVLKDGSSNVIWTADPISGTDFGTVPVLKTGSGSPTGVVAGTQASASVLPTQYWDYTTAILYVCTTTGSVSTAVWTAINASATTPAVPMPQGYLTPTSALPIIVASVSAATAVYYTPFVGNLVPIYNGTSMTPTEFAELTLTLASQHASSAIYDVFVFSNSGVLTLATGPAWTTATAGAGARGTGAGTTQLTRVKGLWVNSVDMTARNGATTYTISANRGTFLGSIYMDSSAGQISCLSDFGTARSWSISNAYNRMPLTLKAGDPTASWAYATATTRQSRGSASNYIMVFSCLPEERYSITFSQNVNGGGNAGTIGIGWNSTTTFSGYVASTPGVSNSVGNNTVATLTKPAALGINQVNMLERADGAATITLFGTEANNLLTASWRA